MTGFYKLEVEKLKERKQKRHDKHINDIITKTYVVVVLSLGLIYEIIRLVEGLQGR